MTLGTPGWRRYYSLRNLIYLLRQHGHTLTALRVTILRGVAKPLLNLPLRPVLGLRHLRSNLRAARDGWTGRLGRQVSPDNRPVVNSGQPSSDDALSTSEEAS
jgi:hypothetical protein